MKKIFLTVLALVFCVVPSLSLCLYLDEEDTFMPSGKGDWFFELKLEPEYAQKYEKATYYPQKHSLSLIYKPDMRDTEKSTAHVSYDETKKAYVKEKKDIYVQAGDKPAGKNIKVYGYYQQQDPLTGKELDTKHWVFKVKKD